MHPYHKFVTINLEHFLKIL